MDVVRIHDFTMSTLRRWSFNQARSLHRMYRWFERVALHLAPGAKWVGTSRLEAIVLSVDRAAKGAFFNCQMCG
jgi:hypothetical protein